MSSKCRCVKGAPPAEPLQRCERTAGGYRPLVIGLAGAREPTVRNPRTGEASGLWSCQFMLGDCAELGVEAWDEILRGTVGTRQFLRILWLALLFDCHSELRGITAERLEHRFLFLYAHRRRNLTRFPDLEA